MRKRRTRLSRGTRGTYQGKCDGQCGWGDTLDLKTGMQDTARRILDRRHAAQKADCDRRIQIEFVPRF